MYHICISHTNTGNNMASRRITHSISGTSRYNCSRSSIFATSVLHCSIRWIRREFAYENALRWMLWKPFMIYQQWDRCREAVSHYLSQCWPRSILSYTVAGPQWINSNGWKTPSITNCAKYIIRINRLCLFLLSVEYCVFQSMFTTGICLHSPVVISTCLCIMWQLCCI